MVFFTAGFGLLFHFLFWGAGLALLITPRHWRMGWPALCAPAGFALQSAIVWFGALTPMAGTRVYAVGTLIIPGALLAFGLGKAVRSQRRNLWRELKAWQGVGLMAAGALNVLLIPFAVASKVLTSSSLGSCDAADYAAGARVLLEFAHTDRTGFMGLTEVVQLHSVTNFFDHWLRLNHFTPSALIALNAAVFSFQPYEIVSVTTAVFVALSLPTVFWLARATFHYGPVASAWLTAVYGLSPLLWYAVYHVAMSQILAALAIALLTGSAIALWQEGASWRRGRAWLGLFFIAYWLLFGAYNFILIVCLVPALAYVGALALATRDWARLGRWSALLLAPLLLVGLVFTQRALGLLERFLLFQQYDFGWKIPALTPEGWLGMVGSVSLSGLPVWSRMLLGGIALSLLVIALVRTSRRFPRKVWLVFSTTVPILLGYLFLQIRGAVQGTNASYDAYKLFCVFYPGILAGLGYWVILTRSSARIVRGAAIFFAFIVLGFNGYAAHRFVRRMQSPPFLVDRSLVQLQRIESMPQVTSLNMLIGDFWSRLWANSFLLKKAQYFSTYTYEGRRNTELKGEWDLLGGVITLKTPEIHDGSRLKAPYSLVNTQSRYFVRVKAGDGWYDPERIARADTYWRWTKGDATIVVENPQAQPLQATLRCALRSLIQRDLQFWANGKQIRSVTIGTKLRTVHLSSIVLPPGTSLIELKSSQSPVSPGPNDARPLGFAAYGIDIEIQPQDDRPVR